MGKSLQQLLNSGDIWQASRQPINNTSCDSGFAQLDANLHNGGWPKAALTELLIQQQGIGEWQLIAPALAQNCQQGQHCMLVAPPYLPYPPALQNAGIACHNIVVVNTKDSSQALWTMEQALRAKVCKAVVGWLGEQALQQAQLRKLQLAARQSGALVFLYRDARFAAQHSPASLRLHISHQRGAMAVNVLKQPGGWSGQRFTLKRPESWLQPMPHIAALPVYTSRDQITATTLAPQLPTTTSDMSHVPAQ